MILWVVFGALGLGLLCWISGFWGLFLRFGGFLRFWEWIDRLDSKGFWSAFSCGFLGTIGWICLWGMHWTNGDLRHVERLFVAWFLLVHLFC